jgi:hypothetical protein
MASTISGPSEYAVAITPHDSTNFTNGTCRGIYVGVAGNVVAVDQNGNAVTFVGCLAGSVIPFQAKRVNSTNTTATSLVALY